MKKYIGLIELSAQRKELNVRIQSELERVKSIVKKTLIDFDIFCLSKGSPLSAEVDISSGFGKSQAGLVEVIVFDIPEHSAKITPSAFNRSFKKKAQKLIHMLKKDTGLVFNVRFEIARDKCVAFLTTP